VVIPVVYVIATAALTLRWARQTRDRHGHVAVDTPQAGVTEG
jgi:hypothetical protein